MKLLFFKIGFSLVILNHDLNGFQTLNTTRHVQIHLKHTEVNPSVNPHKSVWQYCRVFYFYPLSQTSLSSFLPLSPSILYISSSHSLPLLIPYLSPPSFSNLSQCSSPRTYAEGEHYHKPWHSNQHSSWILISHTRVQAGRWQVCYVQTICMSLPANSKGVIKPLWRHGPKVALSLLCSWMPRESGFYRACLGLSQHRACRPRSISCLGKGCSCCRREITFVGNPEALLWRPVNSNKIWTINWPKQQQHSALMVLRFLLLCSTRAMKIMMWKRAGIFCLAFNVFMQGRDKIEERPFTVAPVGNFE